MAALSIRGLDDRVKQQLCVRAARHGRSMESEIRAILTDAVDEPTQQKDFLTTIYERFQEVGGVDLDLPERSAVPRAADFG